MNDFDKTSVLAFYNSFLKKKKLNFDKENINFRYIHCCMQEC